MSINIIYMPVDDLIAYENNAKIHTPEQIEKIKESIRQFGMNDPIAIWKDRTIIEGHGRLQACKELGMKQAPVIMLDRLTDEQRKAYALVHNKLAIKTGFDYEKIFDELASITDINMKPFDIVEDFDISGLDQFPEQKQEKAPAKKVRCPHCQAVFEL